MTLECGCGTNDACRARCRVREPPRLPVHTGPYFVDVPMKTCYLNCCWFVVTVPPGRWGRLELAGTLTVPVLLQSGR